MYSCFRSIVEFVVLKVTEIHQRLILRVEVLGVHRYLTVIEKN